MSSWYSNLLTKTTTQISTLRSTLLSSEADGDTEDDTHVCRVLRNYYTEKGRPFPGWLPPDPKAPPPQPAAQPLYAQVQGGRPAHPQQHLQQQQQQQQQQQGGGLSSLWDSGPQRQTPTMPQSLRVGRQPVGGGGLQRGGAQRDDGQVRPLSSQRPGSYQNPGRESAPPATGGGGPGAGGGASAQDRLRQRLWGGARTVSPSQTGQAYQPPAPAGGGGGNYEDRFAPGGSYDDSRGADRPVMSANSPWGGGGYEYYESGGGGGGGGGGVGRRQGLPSGPRAYR